MQATPPTVLVQRAAAGDADAMRSLTMLEVLSIGSNRIESIDEWIASLGLLDAFHDPERDPPKDAILVMMRAKNAAMCAEEAEWMRALQAEI